MTVDLIVMNLAESTDAYRNLFGGEVVGEHAEGVSPSMTTLLIDGAYVRLIQLREDIFPAYMDHQAVNLHFHVNDVSMLIQAVPEYQMTVMLNGADPISNVKYAALYDHDGYVIAVSESNDPLQNPIDRKTLGEINRESIRLREAVFKS